MQWQWPRTHANLICVFCMPVHLVSSDLLFRQLGISQIAGNSHFLWEAKFTTIYPRVRGIRFNDCKIYHLIEGLGLRCYSQMYVDSMVAFWLLTDLIFDFLGITQVRQDVCIYLCMCVIVIIATPSNLKL